jgi:hypothetical protein
VSLVADRGSVLVVNPIAEWLILVNDSPQFSAFAFRQIQKPRCPVFLESLRFSGAWNSDEALRSNPGKSNLCQGASLLGCNGFYLINNILVLVEIVALELGNLIENVSPQNHQEEGIGGKRTSTAEIILSEVVRSLERKIVDKPAVSKWTERYERNIQFPRRVDQSVRLVLGLKCRVFRLHSVDFGN